VVSAKNDLFENFLSRIFAVADARILSAKRQMIFGRSEYVLVSNSLMPFSKVGEQGEVMHLAKSGRLIVKLNAAGSGIRPGELLFDGSGKRVGKVVELLGPVTAPYASVIPMTDRTGRIVGSKVFSGGFAKSHGQSKGAGRSTRSRYKRK
jgi:RNA-binding protein